MLVPRPEDSVHKAWLLRLLTEIADHPDLVSVLWFKGGTCAAMRGMLNRFSVDLDFDAFLTKTQLPYIRQQLEHCFQSLGLTIKDQSQNGIQYFLQYPAKPNQRNTIKIDTLLPPPRSNVYEAVYLLEIDRSFNCQAQTTMVANKLVAVLDRYEHTHAIAGRDIYDVHAFLMQGFRYRSEVIQERRGTSVKAFFNELIAFIEKQVNPSMLDQDLNLLLPLEEFKRVRQSLKQETLVLLRDELLRLEQT